MKLILSVVLLFVATSCSQSSFLQADAVALSLPVIQVDNTFFTETATISVGETQAGSRVHYTVDGSIPTLGSPAAAQEISVDKSQVLTFRSLGGGFLPSELVSVEILKLPTQTLTLISATPASPPYNEVSESALTDVAKAGKNFRKTDWLGYQDSLLTFELSLDGGPVNGILVSVLEDQANWIFAPRKLKATFYGADDRATVAYEILYPAAKEKGGSSFRFLKIETDDIRPAKVRLEIHPLLRIPDWHPGAGQRGWVFLDEVLPL